MEILDNLRDPLAGRGSGRVFPPGLASGTMVAMARWLLAGFLLLTGCDKLPFNQPKGDDEAGDRAKANCRNECGSKYKACLADCKNDSPQACETQCDKYQQKCIDKCNAP